MATDEELAELLRNVRLLLLDFDGPVTALMGDGRSAQIADSMRIAMGGRPPGEILATQDPLRVLGYAREVRHPQFPQVEEACVAGEIEAAMRSSPTEGIESLLDACSSRACPIVIVSNNSGSAIDTFLNEHHLSRHIAAIVGRPRGYPELRKPAPNLLAAGLEIFGRKSTEALMFGDSVTDVDAARILSIEALGFAKTSARGHELLAAGAAAVFPAIRDLADTWASL